MTLVVNGERVDPAQIDAEVERLRPAYETHVQAQDDSGEAGLEQLRQWARENVIERMVVLQAARAMPIEIPQSEVDAAYEEAKEHAGEAPAEEVKADIELRMRVDRLMAENVQEVPEPTEDELRQYYQENRDRFTVPEQVRASHIVKHVQGEGDRMAAYQRVLEAKMELAGGASFEDLAVKYSDCPERAGDLGAFGRGQMVQEFEDVVFSMQVGEVSDIFLTQFGYHIAKLYERRASRTVPFEHVRDDIARELHERRRQQAVEAFVDSLKDQATIQDAQDE